jgi:hypothetical protein
MSVIDEQFKIKSPYLDYQVFNSKLLGRMFPDLESVTALHPRVLAIDYKTFYPYSTFEIERLFVLDDITPLDDPQVMAIHWFNGNRLSHIYTSMAQPYPCSMTTILKTEGYL